MKETWRILAVNPGSTSTKISLFDNTQIVFSKNIVHTPEELKPYPTVQDQLPYRREMVEETLKQEGIDIETIDVYAGRGGGLLAVKGGTYKVEQKMVEHASTAISGAHHPAQLGSQICDYFAKRYNKPAFIANPPDTDEFQDLARITGFSGLYRKSHVHALNQKEVAYRYCQKEGVCYGEVNLIVCHIGGGISIAAHRKGEMVDANGIIDGEGPMMPSRSGALPAVSLAKEAEKDLPGVLKRINKTGGLLEHLGTDSTIEVENRIANGDKHAELIYNAMIYQIAKAMGSCACVLKGNVHGIILTGGISKSKYVTELLQEYCGWIAPITVMPGEFEMEALAAAALRVMRGEEAAKTYTGERVWQGFDFEEQNK